MIRKIREKSSINTIQGKVMLLSIVSFIAIIILGAVGIFALNKNNSSNQAINDINNESLLQNENNTLNTSYLYFLDSSYLEEIVKNLDKMTIYANNMGNSISGQNDKINKMINTIKKTKENYSNIISTSEERGFTPSTGNYVNFQKNEQDLITDFHNISFDNSWVDGQWKGFRIGEGEVVEIDGKKYTKVTYKGEVPKIGKRDIMIIRVAESALVYSGNAYFNNIKFTDGDANEVLDIDKYKKSDLTGSTGEELKDFDVVTFNKLPSIYTKLEFKGKQDWTDIQIKLDVSNYDFYKYKEYSYDTYFEITDNPWLSVNMAFADKYKFQGVLDQINLKFTNYSKLVVEGKDTSEQAKELNGLFDEIEYQLPIYVVEDDARNKVAGLLAEKRDAFTKMVKADEQITALKKENIKLESDLTKICQELKDTVESSTATTKRILLSIIIAVIAMGAVIIASIGFIVVKGLKNNISNFRKTLESISKGDLSVRATVKGKDEFYQFSMFLNIFADKLATIMKSVQAMTEDVRSKNVVLVQTIHDVVNAQEIDKAGILQIQSMFGEITESVNHQSSNTEECLASINEICSMNESMIKSIERTNGKTTDTLVQVTNSHDNIKGLKEDIDNINNTVDVATDEINELISKVRSIDEILNAINELSEQTNLLALNASIEASRAGEHGKGFSVVAMEIKKLAEQTGYETEKISELTNTINQNIDKVQRANDDVEHTVAMTLEKTDGIEQLMEEVKESSDKSSSDINKISHEMSNQNIAMKEMLNAVAQVSEETERIQDKTITTLQVTSKLAEVLTDSMDDVNTMIQSVEKLKEDINYFNA